MHLVESAPAKKERPAVSAASTLGLSVLMAAPFSAIVMLTPAPKVAKAALVAGALGISFMALCLCQAAGAADDEENW